MLKALIKAKTIGYHPDLRILDWPVSTADQRRILVDV
jgi:hypothetical protein